MGGHIRCWKEEIEGARAELASATKTKYDHYIGDHGNQAGGNIQPGNRIKQPTP
jgi:hypothetical protein